MSAPSWYVYYPIFMLLPPAAILILDLVPTLLFPPVKPPCFPLFKSLLFEKGPNSVELSKLILDDCFLPVSIYIVGLPVLI